MSNISQTKLSLNTRTLQLGPLRLKIYQLWVFFLAGLTVLFGVSTSEMGYTVRPERLLVVAWLIFFLPLLSLSFIRIWDNFRVRKILILLLFWLMCGLLSSLDSVEPSASFRHWVDLSLAVMFLFLVLSVKPVRLIRDRQNAILWLAILLGLGGVLAAVLRHFNLVGDDSVWSFFIGEEIGYFRVRMTMLEPNLYGAVMMVLALLTIAELRVSNNIFSKLSFIAAHLGLLLSFSRGPIVGYIIGLVIFLLLMGYKRLFKGIALFLFVGLLTMLIVGLNSSEKKGPESVLNRYSSVSTRLTFLQLAIPDILESPFFGNGVYSFSFMHPEAPHMVGSETEGNAWLPSLPLNILYDNGLIGLALLGSFFYLLLRSGYRAIKYARPRFVDSRILCRAAGWLVSGIALLVSSLATPTYSLAFFWGVMAIVYNIPRAIQMLENQDVNTILDRK